MKKSRKNNSKKLTKKKWGGGDKIYFSVLTDINSLVWNPVGKTSTVVFRDMKYLLEKVYNSLYDNQQIILDKINGLSVKKEPENNNNDWV